MKIGLAQIKPFKGDVGKNIELHLQFIQKAILNKVDAIFFPELSITSYEPELADRLKMEMDNPELAVFQKKSNEGNIIIGLGVPSQTKKGVEISMLIFQPNRLRQKYSKQILHKDELPYFINGKKQILIKHKNYNIAPAICYESLHKTHLEKAISMHANIYLASVAKSQSGLDKAKDYFSKVSKQYGIPILMSNAVGFCDNFESVGQSSIWNKEGKRIGRLREKEEGLLIYDTKTEKAFQC